LSKFKGVLDLDNIVDLQLEEYENMKDYVAHMRKVKQKQKEYAEA